MDRSLLAVDAIRPYDSYKAASLAYEVVIRYWRKYMPQIRVETHHGL